jgi:hypothetical protein
MWCLFAFARRALPRPSVPNPNRRIAADSVVAISAACAARRARAPRGSLCWQVDDNVLGAVCSKALRRLDVADCVLLTSAAISVSASAKPGCAASQPAAHTATRGSRGCWRCACAALRGCVAPAAAAWLRHAAGPRRACAAGGGSALAAVDGAGARRAADACRRDRHRCAPCAACNVPRAKNNLHTARRRIQRGRSRGRHNEPHANATCQRHCNVGNITLLLRAA